MYQPDRGRRGFQQNALVSRLLWVDRSNWFWIGQSRTLECKDIISRRPAVFQKFRPEREILLRSASNGPRSRNVKRHSAVHDGQTYRDLLYIGGVEAWYWGCLSVVLGNIGY